MLNDSINITQALAYGWSKTKQHFWFFAGVLIVTGLLANIAGLIELVPANRRDGLFVVVSILLTVGAWLLQFLLRLGLIKISLTIIEGQVPFFRLLFSEYKKLLNYFIASVLYVFIIICGLILFIIPGIVWAIKYQFYGYLMVDKNMRPLEALHTSGVITQGVKWKLLAMGVLFSIINILGALALVIGLFFTIPTTMVAWAHIYKQLTQRMTVTQPTPQNSPVLNN